MEYIIREMHSMEYPLLNDFLYEAIFIPEGVEPPVRSIINAPELQVYIADFGKEKDDICFVAEAIACGSKGKLRSKDVSKGWI